MRITALTTACYRPEAWALVERYVARQTLQPAQWIVLDDDTPKTVCTLGQEYHHWPEMSGRGSLVRKIRRAVSGKMIKGDAIVFVENDDWLAPDWLELCAKWLESFTLFGEGRALYYTVRGRYWFEHVNLQHASLCSTAIRKDGFAWLLEQTNNSECPFLDVRLWRRPPFSARVFDPYRDPQRRRRTIGIKAMPGRTGYGGGHKGRDRSAVDDPDLVKLRSLIGDDADAYAPFFAPCELDKKPEHNLYTAQSATTPPAPKLSAREWHRQYVEKNGAPPMRYYDPNKHRTV